MCSFASMDRMVEDQASSFVVQDAWYIHHGSLLLEPRRMSALLPLVRLYEWADSVERYLGTVDDLVRAGPLAHHAQNYPQGTSQRTQHSLGQQVEDDSAPDNSAAHSSSSVGSRVDLKPAVAVALFRIEFCAAHLLCAQQCRT